MAIAEGRVPFAREGTSVPRPAAPAQSHRPSIGVVLALAKLLATLAAVSLAILVLIPAVVAAAASGT